MTDDRFDDGLSERLRAYESRLPAAAPPDPGAHGSRSGLRWPIIGVGTLAVVAAALLVAVLLRSSPDENVGESSSSPVPSPSASESVPRSDSAEPIQSQGSESTPTPQPTASTQATVDLAWTEVASFGTADTPTMVNDVVRSDGGLVAVGVAYDMVLPNVGPTPPHEGRVWLSTSTSTWEDVTPDLVFADATLIHVLVTSDRRILAYGLVDTDEFGAQRFAAWESIAGLTWEEVDTGFPDGSWPTLMAQGTRGHVALVAEPETRTLAAWHSSDGRAWQRVHDLGPDEGIYAVGAGDEGFVIVGSAGAEETPLVIASGDGQSWFEAAAPPSGVPAAVAPRGGDWWMLTREPNAPLGQPSTAGAWMSHDGLEWSSAGAMPLQAADECTEWPISLYSAGPWLVAGTLRQYPCSEGGFRTYGAQRISLDGIEWSELPFGAASKEGNLGTRIGGALEVDGRLVLVGEKDRVATFWVGEQP